MRRVLVAGLLFAGCVKANLVIVDRNTALEDQAAGSYPSLAEGLEQAGVQPGPVPMTRAQIEASGIVQTDDALMDTSTETSDGSRIERLLVRRCVGEALDGTVVATASTCTGSVDAQDIARLVERINRNRRQVWRFLEQTAPQAKPEAVRRAWRATRLREASCGAAIQRPDGTWEIKKC